MTSRRAAVLGHPIAHSLSPVLHNAAYGALGIDWQYEALDVTEAEFAAFVAGLGDEWAGLSLTMPLKVEAVRHMDFIEPMAKLVGAVNTVLIQTTGAGRHLVGANTDVYGIVAALREANLTEATQGVILGGGATATSAMAALGQLGVTTPIVAVRDRARAGGLLRAATKMGVAPRFVPLDQAQEYLADAQVVVSTIPADAGEALAERLTLDGGVALRGALLDVIYAPLVTPLGSYWEQHGGRRTGGERMLAHQAGEQVRLMTGKPAPFDAMMDALGAVLN